MNVSYNYHLLDIDHQRGYNSFEYQVWKNPICYIDPSVLIVRPSPQKCHNQMQKNSVENGRRLKKEGLKLFGIWIWYLFFSLLLTIGLIIFASGYILGVVDPKVDPKVDPSLWSLSEIFCIVGAGLLVTGIYGLIFAYIYYHDLDPSGAVYVSMNINLC